jgi:shikimate dehydrogenase
MTDRYGVIGHPIAHSRSPQIHQLFASQTRQDLSYEAFDIAPAELEDRVLELADEGLRGLNITVPHKTAVLELVNSLSERARRAGAVNTLLFHVDGSWHGDNTDGVGLLRDLAQNLGIAIADRRLLVLGAGGAARGILPELLAGAPASLVIANRTLLRARILAAEFGDLGPVTACGYGQCGDEPFDLVINATSAGLHGELPGFPATIIGPATTCYDLSYASGDTPFVAWARAQGAAAAHQGLGMLVEQAAESFFLWRRVRPDTQPVLAALRAALAAG